MAFFSDCSWRRMKSQPSSRMFVLICSLHKWHLIRRVLFQGFMMSFSAGSKSLFIQRRSQPGGTVSLSLGHMALCLVLLFSRLVVSDCLRPHGLQHARLACPSLSHYFLSQIHVHCANDAIQPSHPLLPPSPPALNSSYAILILFKLYWHSEGLA